MSSHEALWMPPADWRTSTLIGELCQRLDAASFDALHEQSLQAPDTYWRMVMEHLDLRWRQQPGGLVDLARGPEFPRWFPGGTLNWTDGVLAQATGSRAQENAVVGESEDGHVTSLTYAELAEEVRALAGGLVAQGVRCGDRVGLMMAMGCASVSAFLAIAAIGAIAVPLFTGFGAAAAASRLALAGTRMLLASSGFHRRGRHVALEPVLRAIAEQLPELAVIVHGGTGADSPFSTWASLKTAPLEALPAFDANHPFMIVFTSGTTGQPKGTVHTHGGFPLKILHDAAYHFELRAGDRWFWPSDMGWIVGPITTVGALMRGATLVCYDGALNHPRASRLAELIDRHRITHFGASPTLVRTLAAAPETTAGVALDSLKVLILAGEVIDREHVEWFFESFGHGRLPVVNYSGGTEASGALLANVLAKPIQACAFNAVSPGVDAFAADEGGRRIKGTPGELVITQPFLGMTASFWEADARYLESYWTQRPSMWTHGDLVVENADGQFVILGRSDDTLKIAGKRVGPAEVEGLVLDLPSVLDVAAVSMPHMVKGDQLVLCVATQGDIPDQLVETISQTVENALGKPFRPGAVHLLAELPKTRNGKVMRRVIRAILRGLPAGDISSLENPHSMEPLRELAENRH